MDFTTPSPHAPRPRLLIVGGTGHLGRLLQPALREGAAAGVQPVWQSRRAETPGQGQWLTFDPLADPAAYAAAARAAEVVLALAGATSGSAADLACNAALAGAALAAAEAAGGRPVILASSAAVYGAGLPPDPARGWSEADSCDPVSAYGAAKCAMEAAVAGRRGVTVLRIGNVAGADALLGRSAPQGGRVLDRFADGTTPRRSYIGPQALARALVRLARFAAAGIALPERINLALPGAVSMAALLEAAGEAWQPRAAPEGAIAEVRLDVTRAVELGLVPEAPARASAILADLRALVAPEEAAA